MFLRRFIRIFIPLYIVSISFSNAQEKRAYKAPEFESEWRKPTRHPDRIVLNFGQEASSQANITWRTSPDVNMGYLEVAVATAAPKFWRNAQTVKAVTETIDLMGVETANVISNYHSVELTGLQPATKYAYRVGDGTIWSEWIQFKTPSVNVDDKFSFLYVGDAQNYILELWSRLVREGFKKAPEASFIIHAGDLVNNGHSEQEWHEWFVAGDWVHKMIASVPVAGNHEYRPFNDAERQRGTRNLSAQWKPQFTLPQNGPEGLKESVYYMHVQDALIISLNSNEQFEKQVAWLEEILKKNTKKWVIVSYHHPLFSASEGRDNEKLRGLWKPVFDKYGVDLALQGHDHSYARGRVSPGDNVIDGLNMRDKTGTVYVVSVSGGKMYDLKQNEWKDYDITMERVAENTQLFQVITIEGNKLSFESYTATGDLYDAFELIKNGTDLPNTFVELKNTAINELKHHNTISYKDQLPVEIEKMLLKKYNGHAIKGINYIKNEDFHGYRVQLVKNKEELYVKVDANGLNLVEEK